ncbi:hypothetical protein [Sphaerisporangium sp. NPDC051011]|uniref:hypothetical protein n=1 Tax=Sphaerisporangium sp. NPDC051011 TaxID=3155792 RepID=UPI0033D1252E
MDDHHDATAREGIRVPDDAVTGRSHLLPWPRVEVDPAMTRVPRLGRWGEATQGPPVGDVERQPPAGPL